jgi:hypothetical protein
MDFTLVAGLFSVERRHRDNTANGDPVRYGATSPAHSVGGGGLSLQLVLGCYFASLVATRSGSRLHLKAVLVVTTNLVLKVIYSV